MLSKEEIEKVYQETIIKCDLTYTTEEWDKLFIQAGAEEELNKVKTPEGLKEKLFQRFGKCIMPDYSKCPLTLVTCDQCEGKILRTIDLFKLSTLQAVANAKKEEWERIGLKLSKGSMCPEYGFCHVKFSRDCAKCWSEALKENSES